MSNGNNGSKLGGILSQQSGVAIGLVISLLVFVGASAWWVSSTVERTARTVSEAQLRTEMTLSASTIQTDLKLERMDVKLDALRMASREALDRTFAYQLKLRNPTLNVPGVDE